MARCSCAGSSCNCTFEATSGLSVRGTGKSGDPFIISIDRSGADANIATPGPLDLSAAVPGAFGTVALEANASEVILPSDANGHIELLIRQDGTGNQVSWPSNVRWPGGVAPTLSTTMGHSDWIDLRRVGDHWVGRLVAAEIG